MSPSSSATASIAPPQKYVLHAYSTQVGITFKALRDAIGEGAVERFGPECLVWHTSRTQKLFLFKFGAVVFFNIPVEEHEQYLSQLGITARAHVPNPDPDNDDLAEDDFILHVEAGKLQVGFNAVTIPEWDLVKLQLVAQLLAQSSALELLERDVESFLGRSEELAAGLRKRGFARASRQQLLQHLGDGLAARHAIINRLALFKEPEKTWEKEDLYTFYMALWENFDIEERVEALEKNLALYTEVNQLLLESANSRRAEFLEAIIILLIAFEVVKSFFA